VNLHLVTIDPTLTFAKFNRYMFGEHRAIELRVVAKIQMVT
jgi:hypothetical protein